VLALFVVLVYGQTVQQVADRRGCSTDAVAGLAKQLVSETNAIRPGLFSDLRNVRGVTLTKAVQSVPYLQTAALNALQRAVSRGGRTLTINSALRTLPQQLLLYKWYTMRACRISAAAKPGASNHNGGLAVDVADPYSWVSAMSSQGFRHLGAGDPPHFDYKGAGGTDVRSLSVRAFQSLWNKNNPNDRLPVDGVYSNAVESRLLLSPANGFAVGGGGGNNDNGGNVGNGGNGGNGGNNDDNGAAGGGNTPTRNGQSCSPSGMRGVCVNTNEDSCNDGRLYRGHCPGGRNIVCCVAGGARANMAENSVLPDQSPVDRDQTYAAITIVVGSIVIAGIASLLVLFTRKLQNLRRV